MKAAIYARVSSERQAEKNLSIPAQLKLAREYCARKEWEVSEVFIDSAESARSANRPEFQRMVTAARSVQEPFQAIVVWKLSRFARNREDSIVYKSLLRRHGVEVVSITERIDDTVTGRLMEGIIEVIDEFYSANLAQDTLRGLKENASRGFYCGGTPPYGYSPTNAGEGEGRRKLEVVPKEAPLVSQVFSWAYTGAGAKDIAARLNQDGSQTRRGKEWTKNTVLYMLQNEIYTGTMVWNNKRSRPKARAESEIIRVPNSHPAIVERQVFEAIQGQIRARRPSRVHPRTVASRYLLSGLLRCGHCGKVMQGGSAKSGQYRYYSCYSRHTKGTSTCPSKALPVELIEEAVLTRIRTHILTKKNLERLVQLVNKEIRQTSILGVRQLQVAESELQDRRSRLDRLFEALETCQLGLDDLAPRIRTLREEIEQLERRKARLHNLPGPIPYTVDDIEAHVLRLRETLGTGTWAQQKAFLRSFVRKVEYKDPVIRIIYTFPIQEEDDGADGSDDGGPTGEVLHIDKIGSSGRTRTYNPPVNSLIQTYHLVASSCF